MRKLFEKSYEDIISLDNLLSAWREFVKGKRNKRDVREFSVNLSDNLVQLHTELTNFTYKHGGYKAFNITDPKPRNIHKAQVRDRVLHHAIYRQLYPFFDRIFISDSFSCRLNKGMHRALNRFRIFALRVSRNNTRTVWVLKLDIRKFFANIDHETLLGILSSYIPDAQISRLLSEVVASFLFEKGKGLPLGNLTSQLFCNIYMNEFDQFVKHTLKVRCFIRYADDFVLLSENRDWLIGQVPFISGFLEQKLKLSLHPDKIFIKTWSSGLDFLGWTHFPDHRVLRTATKRKMLHNLQNNPEAASLASYLGMLSHGDAFKLEQEVLNTFWLNSE